ncbi:MAG: hypothetical protein AAFW73_09385 [Bacteroidota bacterium]
MEESRKYLMDKFQDHLVESYHSYCETYGIPVSYAGFVTYLIDHELISKTSVKRYTVLKEFATCLPVHANKTAAVAALSKCFNISTRSVWSILKNDHEFEKSGVLSAKRKLSRS